jgi:uncharacterized membrane protein
MFSLLHSVPWVHLVPAVLAVLFGLLYLKTKWFYLKVIFGFVWLVLLPNTSYIFIGIGRISLHWNSASINMRSVLIIQYIILEAIGLVTYLLAMLPFENIIRAWYFSHKAQIFAIMLLNFLVGFGMTLGRTGYTNSYVIFTQPAKVLLAAMHIVTSFNQLSLAIAFGILCNCVYFLFRSTFLRRAQRLI